MSDNENPNSAGDDEDEAEGDIRVKAKNASKFQRPTDKGAGKN
jgi:hypothetical protein